MSGSTHPQTPLSQQSTYQLGVLQASAHRTTNRVITEYLSQYDLTAMQWFTIGCIYDASDPGIRLSDLTRTLSTTLPYITNTVALLESKGMVRKVTHASDSRIKLVSITPQFLSTVTTIEDDLQAHLHTNLYGNTDISIKEFQEYSSVLTKIALHS